MDDFIDALTVYEAAAVDERHLATVTDLALWAEYANSTVGGGG